MANDPDIAALVDELQIEYDKLAHSPLGMTAEWEVKASGGKPLLYGGKRGLLAYGTIATWGEFALVTKTINALPVILTALRAALTPDAQTRQHLGQDHVRKIDAKAGEIPRTVDSGLRPATPTAGDPVAGDAKERRSIADYIANEHACGADIKFNDAEVEVIVAALRADVAGDVQAARTLDQIRIILSEEADIDFAERRIDYGNAVERIAALPRDAAQPSGERLYTLAEAEEALKRAIKQLGPAPSVTSTERK